MNKHTLGIIGIIIILIIGGFFFFSNKAEAPEGMSDALPVNTEGTMDDTRFAGDPELEDGWSDTDQTPQDLPNDSTTAVTIVTYTDSGYTPETVEIKKGDTVRFVNESSGRLWTASDIHPTHSLYPTKTSGDCLGSAFDECRASVQGESYEFIFDEVGEWRYHNHVRASKRGVVIVE